MLNRVRDFRYQEIKNWKPLVSLRESYRRESAFRNAVLVATCLLAVLFGYSVINGSLGGISPGRIDPNMAAADRGLGESTLGTRDGVSVAGTTPSAEVDARTREVGAASARPTLADQQELAGSHRFNSGDMTSGSTARSASNESLVTPSQQVNLGRLPIPSSGNQQGLRTVGFQETGTASSQETNADGRVSTDSRAISPMTAYVSRIAVCDVQQILSPELTLFADELAAKSEQQLRQEQMTVYQNAARFSDVEIFVLQKLFEQKKQQEIAILKDEVAAYRALLEDEIQRLADQVADTYEFEIVLAGDDVLSYTQANDITAIVNQAWLQQKQAEAQARIQDRGGRNLLPR